MRAGAYACDGVTRPPFKRQHSPLLPLAAALLAVAAGAHRAGELVAEAGAAREAAWYASHSDPAGGAGGRAGAGGGGTCRGAPGGGEDEEGGDGSRGGGGGGGGECGLGGGPPPGGLAGGLATLAALPLGPLLQGVVAPALLGVGLLLLVWNKGRHLVDRPQLCPAAAATVARPAHRRT